MKLSTKKEVMRAKLQQASKAIDYWQFKSTLLKKELEKQTAYGDYAALMAVIFSMMWLITIVLWCLYYYYGKAN